jgi:hypothetical protein
MRVYMYVCRRSEHAPIHASVRLAAAQCQECGGPMVELVGTFPMSTVEADDGSAR